MLKKVLIGLIAVNILAIITAGAYAYISYRKVVVKANRPRLEKDTTPTPTPTPDPDRPFSIALLGYGGGTHEGGRLTDSIMVARIFPKNQKISLVSVPRDIWVNLPVSESETKGYKINAAYAIGLDDRLYPEKPAQYTGPAGGGEMAKKVIGEVVGFPVDYFIALDFSGFTKVIDSLGGVDINVERSFEDPLYPIEGKETDTCGRSQTDLDALTATMSGSKLEEAFTCRYEDLKFEKGITHMDGSTALKYVRSRHSLQDGGDFNRAARQRNLIDAVKQKVISLNFIPKIIPTVKTLSSHVQTDIDFKTMENYLTRASEFLDYNITSLALTDGNVLRNSKSADGQFILEPISGAGDFSVVHDYVTTGIVPSPTLRPSSTPKN